MKKFKSVLIISLLVLFSSYGTLFSWESYDGIVAVVNSIPIVGSEVQAKFEQVKKLKKINRKKIAFEKSRVLDNFIENALVYEAAEEKSIIISDLKVMNQIEAAMMNYFVRKGKKGAALAKLVKSISEIYLKKIRYEKMDSKNQFSGVFTEFENYIKKTQKCDVYQYFTDTRKQLRKQQVMSIAIGVSSPSKGEAYKWYKKNKRKLGDEVNVKHILIKVRNTSLKEEKKASKFISGLRKRIIKGEPFEKIARKYSQCPSAAKGGNLGWMALAELDPYFANHVYKMNKKGSLSKVFKSGFGYHIVKYYGKRPVTYEKVERMILYKLYNENMARQFLKWVARRKRYSEIKIFMKDYIKG